MKRYDLIVIGAGPAGLSAATEAAKHGLHPLVLDENEKPGGQLFKQIHQVPEDAIDVYKRQGARPCNSV